MAHSIVNDVLGPVMTGPSSSHTAGPARIGKAVSLLWGKPIRRARVCFDQGGSYPETHVGQGSDMGFAGGLLGLSPDHPDLRRSLALAKEQGVDLSFTFAGLNGRHPNEARIDILDKTGLPALSVLTLSTGGGTFQLVEMDGFPISYDGGSGRTYLAVEAGPAADGLEARLARMGACSKKRTADPSSVTFTALPGGGAPPVLYEIAGELPPGEAADALLKRPGLLWARRLPPIAPVSRRAEQSLPFTDAAGALALAKDTGGSMAELALLYECAWGEITKERVRGELSRVLAVMRGASKPPGEECAGYFRIVSPVSAKLWDAADGPSPLPLGFLPKSAAAALSVMENSAARGIIAAAPTAGSSGVLPATVVLAGEELGLSDDRIADGLLAAGLVGSFIANQVTFAAESAGCQAEIGSATAMAAAGLVQLLGGTAETGFAAASLALQNALGLICDPVGGVAEVPCMARNAMAASAAATAAHMALCGVPASIPLDEVITAMGEVGRMLPSALRCTCGGGLCATKTGKAIAAQIKRQGRNSSPPVVSI